MFFTTWRVGLFFHSTASSQFFISRLAVALREEPSAANFLKAAIDNVNTKQYESDVMTQKLIMGENVELHDVMITAQKATIALNATMEVRNKVVEAYQEIIRMPV